MCRRQNELTIQTKYIYRDCDGLSLTFRFDINASKIKTVRHCCLVPRPEFLINASLTIYTSNSIFIKHKLLLEKLNSPKVGIDIFTVRNVVAARLCFHRCLWFCSQERGVCPGGVADTNLGRHPLGHRHPPGQTPPAQCMLGYTPPCPVYVGIHIPPA